MKVNLTTSKIIQEQKQFKRKAGTSRDVASVLLIIADIIDMETGGIVFLLVNIIILGSGLYFNVFISVFSYRTWLSRGFQHPQGLLLFCIGLSSAMFILYLLFTKISYYIWTEEFLSFNVCTVAMLCLYTFCHFFNVCQTSWLCSFYCIKLVSIKHWILQVLRLKLSSILPWIIAGTLVISGMGLVLLFSLIYISVPIDNSDNSTSYCRRIKEDYIGQMLVLCNGLNIIISLPIFLILVSLSCTVSTLVQHIWRVRGTLSLDRSHLEAHIHAATTMILLLGLNTSFYALNMLGAWSVLPPSWMVVCEVIYSLFWPLQALTLIFRTKKLYGHFICCLCRQSP